MNHVDSHHNGESNVIVLNVGGTLYTTTRTTLTKYPESMLGAMFGGQFMTSTIDHAGNYFIDRDGELFRHVLNFLRSDRLCLPKSFTDYDLLEAEADFYQIPDLIAAVRESNKPGQYLELLEFEETAYFHRFYSDPPKSINTELKSGGIVVSGSTMALRTLPLPAKTIRELEKIDAPYKSVNIPSITCSKMAIVHDLNAKGWKLLETSFKNNSDTDGSYMVHKYLWYLSS